MSSQDQVQPESLSTPFLAGTYVFTRNDAINCARLHKAGVTVWQLKQEFFPGATVREVIVAIQVGIMIEDASFTLEQLLAVAPKVFDTTLVLLAMWTMGGAMGNNMNKACREPSSFY